MILSLTADSNESQPCEACQGGGGGMSGRAWGCQRGGGGMSGCQGGGGGCQGGGEGCQEGGGGMSGRGWENIREGWGNAREGVGEFILSLFFAYVCTLLVSVMRP